MVFAPGHVPGWGKVPSLGLGLPSMSRGLLMGHPARGVPGLQLHSCLSMTARTFSRCRPMPRGLRSQLRDPQETPPTHECGGGPSGEAETGVKQCGGESTACEHRRDVRPPYFLHCCVSLCLWFSLPNPAESKLLPRAVRKARHKAGPGETQSPLLSVAPPPVLGPGPLQPLSPLVHIVGAQGNMPEGPVGRVTTGEEKPVGASQESRDPQGGTVPQTTNEITRNI